MTRGKLITIEGSEGAGKSTTLAFIQSYLEQANKNVVLTREPGGTQIAEMIRNILLQQIPQEDLNIETELLLMFAGRAQHIKYFLQPALRAGQWVVSDRYIDASYAYQGGGRGIDIRYLKALDELIVGSLYPDLTLLLDIPVEQGLARAKQRNGTQDRIEQEAIDFFQRVRDTYLARAKQDPERIKVIDASVDIPNVQAQIKKVLDTFLTSLSA